MRWLRLLFRIFGWLLTPLLAWAASFFGAVGGALLAIRIANPLHGLAITAVCGAIAGYATLWVWLQYLVRHPEVREVLAVTEHGTPDTTEHGTPDTTEFVTEPDEQTAAAPSFPDEVTTGARPESS